jgi:hypothetical protein
LEKELEKEHEFGESSFHFASNNYCEPLLFTCLKKARAWEQNLFEVSNYERNIVITPRLNEYIAGYPVTTSRGITVMKWFCAPYSFFEFWKLLMCSTNYHNNYNYGPLMPSLRHRVKGEQCSFFAELAKAVLFNVKHNDKNVDLFLSSMLDNLRKIN